MNSSTFNVTASDKNLTAVNDHSYTRLEESLLDILNRILTEDISLIVYTILILTSIVLATTRSLCFFRFCMTASRKLHNLMFGSIIRAPMRFFNANPAGRILNRFSQDIGTVDEVLPLTIADTFQVNIW